jgi:hypothetical protein
MAPDQVHLANANPLIQRSINRGNIGRGFRFADFWKAGGGHGLAFLWRGMMGRKPGLSHPPVISLCQVGAPSGVGLL